MGTDEEISERHKRVLVEAAFFARTLREWMESVTDEMSPEREYLDRAVDSPFASIEQRLRDWCAVRMLP